MACRMSFFGYVDELHGGFVEQGCGGYADDVGVFAADALAEEVVGEFFCLAVDDVYFVAFFFSNCAKVS